MYAPCALCKIALKNLVEFTAKNEFLTVKELSLVFQLNCLMILETRSKISLVFRKTYEISVYMCLKQAEKNLPMG